MKYETYHKYGCNEYAPHVYNAWDFCYTLASFVMWKQILWVTRTKLHKVVPLHYKDCLKQYIEFNTAYTIILATHGFEQYVLHDEHRLILKKNGHAQPQTNSIWQQKNSAIHVQ